MGSHGSDSPHVLLDKSKFVSPKHSCRSLHSPTSKRHSKNYNELIEQSLTIVSSHEMGLASNSNTLPLFPC